MTTAASNRRPQRRRRRLPHLRCSIALAASLACACSVTAGEIHRGDMPPRSSYLGFSFARPVSWEWYLLRSDEHDDDVMLRRHLHPESDTHSFFARVSLGHLDRQPASASEFAEMARATSQDAPYQVQLVSYEQHPAPRQEQWCIRFDSSYLVRGSPVAPHEDLTMILRGYRCLHPKWPRTTLDFFYSERGPASEIDPGLSREGEAFLDGVRIDMATDMPANAASSGSM
ncbi:MAG TPA: hypothetical protein VGK20_11680 [Candidatus Binatia bacterium]|jgi:hypothetical protein